MFSLRVLGMQRLSHIHSNSSTALSSIALCDFCVTASGLHLFAGLGLFDCSTSETRASHGVKRPKRSGASHRFNATRSMTRTAYAICSQKTRARVRRSVGQVLTVYTH